MLPEFLKSNFWSYKLESLDKDKDKNLIIFNILNFGGYEAWLWLFKNYSHSQIKEAIKKSVATAWFKSSINLWQNVFDVKARPQRFLDEPTPLAWPH